VIFEKPSGRKIMLTAMKQAFEWAYEKKVYVSYAAGC